MQQFCDTAIEQSPQINEPSSVTSDANARITQLEQEVAELTQRLNELEARST